MPAKKKTKSLVAKAGLVRPVTISTSRMTWTHIRALREAYEGAKGQPGKMLIESRTAGGRPGTILHQMSARLHNLAYTHPGRTLFQVFYLMTALCYFRFHTRDEAKQIVDDTLAGRPIDDKFIRHHLWFGRLNEVERMLLIDEISRWVRKFSDRVRKAAWRNKDKPKDIGVVIQYMVERHILDQFMIVCNESRVNIPDMVLQDIAYLDVAGRKLRRNWAWQGNLTEAIQRAVLLECVGLPGDWHHVDFIAPWNLENKEA